MIQNKIAEISTKAALNSIYNDPRKSMVKQIDEISLQPVGIPKKVTYHQNDGSKLLILIILIINL